MNQNPKQQQILDGSTTTTIHRSTTQRREFHFHFVYFSFFCLFFHSGQIFFPPSSSSSFSVNFKQTKQKKNISFVDQRRKFSFPPSFPPHTHRFYPHTRSSSTNKQTTGSILSLNERNHFLSSNSSSFSSSFPKLFTFSS